MTVSEYLSAFPRAFVCAYDESASPPVIYMTHSYTENLYMLSKYEMDGENLKYIDSHVMHDYIAEVDDADFAHDFFEKNFPDMELNIKVLPLIDRVRLQREAGNVLAVTRYNLHDDDDMIEEEDDFYEDTDYEDDTYDYDYDEDDPPF